ncbi:MAG: outer membrane beta-barrel protein [Rhodobacteraceae bacterium]|nr:outer membrane beta-barrel protein [Paracoccaceae bacterium]
MSLRGSSNDMSSDSSSSEIDEEDAVEVVDPTDGLRLNSALVEEGSDAFGASLSAVRVRPFSDRVAAVSRRAGSSGSTDMGGTFTGDTTFDQPIGLRFGSFTVLPELTINGAWSDNLEQSASGTQGTSYRIAPSVAVSSDWAQHQLDLGIRGSYADDEKAGSEASQSLGADLALRLDLNDETTATANAAYSLARESGSSAEAGYVASDENTHQLSGNVGLKRTAGIVGVTLKGGLNRTSYEEAKSRNNTVYTLGLRTDLATNAIATPFVEASALTRRYDKKSASNNRNSVGYELRGGLVVASGSKLNGEVGLGWRQEKLDSGAYDDLSGLTVDGSLVWSPSRLTTVTAGLSSSFEATTLAQSSGSIVYAGDLRIAHGFSDRLVGDLGVGYQLRDYQGVSIDEHTITGTAGTTFALTKNAALLTRFTQKRFLSSSAGSSYNQSTVEAGLRFRH